MAVIYTSFESVSLTTDGTCRASEVPSEVRGRGRLSSSWHTHGPGRSTSTTFIVLHSIDSREITF